MGFAFLARTMLSRVSAPLHATAAICKGCDGRAEEEKLAGRKLFCRAIDLKPPEMLIDSCRGLMDLSNKISHGTVVSQ